MNNPENPHRGAEANQSDQKKGTHCVVCIGEDQPAAEGGE